MITCGEEELLSKEEVVKLFTSWEQGGRLHYHPGTCWISCKTQCKEVVLSVRKLTLQVLHSVRKVMCPTLSPDSPVFNWGIICLRFSLRACAGSDLVLTTGIFFKTGKYFVSISSAPLISGQLMVQMWVACWGFCASTDALL